MADLTTSLAALTRRRGGEETPEREASGRDRFVNATAGGGHRRRRVPRGGLALLAAAAVVVSLALLMWPASVLRYELRGASGAEQGYVQASAGPATVAFSDGTTVTVEQGSAARIVEVTQVGARVLLERGRATVQVVPSDSARWTLAAGPYLVTVTGTHFEMGWTPAEDRFELVLHEGTVTVRGPQLEGGLAMRAGQRLVARVGEGDLQLGPIPRAGASSAAEAGSPPQQADGSADAAAPSAPASVAHTPTEATPETGVRKSDAPSWSLLVAGGEYQRVIDEARAIGTQAVLQAGPLDQLLALSEAARYRGEGALARRALTALRDRFATSPAAKTAAFLLGRMSEGSPSSAIAWYDRYLAEAPAGPYAAEALGRKLHLLTKSDRAAARDVAKQYLAAYPKGAYAALARELSQR